MYDVYVCIYIHIGMFMFFTFQLWFKKPYTRANCFYEMVNMKIKFNSVFFPHKYIFINNKQDLCERVMYPSSGVCMFRWNCI